MELDDPSSKLICPFVVRWAKNKVTNYHMYRNDWAFYMIKCCYILMNNKGKRCVYEGLAKEA